MSQTNVSSRCQPSGIIERALCCEQFNLHHQSICISFACQQVFGSHSPYPQAQAASQPLSGGMTLLINSSNPSCSSQHPLWAHLPSQLRYVLGDPSHCMACYSCNPILFVVTTHPCSLPSLSSQYIRMLSPKPSSILLPSRQAWSLPRPNPHHRGILHTIRTSPFSSKILLALNQSPQDHPGSPTITL